MKITKHISPIIFLVALVNVIYCQNVTKNERIIWNNIPDSINIFYPLFSNSSYNSNYNTAMYVSKYYLPNKNYNVFFSDIACDNITPQEQMYLETNEVLLSDSVVYQMHVNENSNSTITATLAIVPYIIKNGNIQRITSYTVSFEKKNSVPPTYNHQKNTNPYPANSVLSSGNWYKIAINTTGIYRITADDMASKGIDISGLAISQLGIYGNGGGALSENNNDFEYNDLAENSIYVKDNNNNGLFDGNDYLLFYAQAADIWKYNKNLNRYEYHVHPYARTNYYYLGINVVGAKRISPTNIQQSASQKILTYTYCSTIHNDLTNTHKSGRIWVGEKFSNAVSSRSFSLAIPHAIVGSKINVRYALASISSANSSFSVTIDGNSQSHSYTPGYKYPYQGYSAASTATAESKCDIDIHYSFRESMATGYLDFIEINATAALSLGSGQLHFRNKENIGNRKVSQFEISNTSSSTRIWNVSDPCNVYEISATHVGSKTTFIDSTTAEGEFIAFDGSHYHTPTSITAINNQNLHGLAQQDYVIVAPSVFAAEAERLAQLHRLYNGLDVVVVTPEQIYAEFSSGKQDPMAIRRFMKMFYDRALANNINKTPRYLLLFGKAVYDNKNITNINIPYVVSYQSETSFDSEGSSYTSDDMFGYLGNWETGSVYESIDIGIGRFPVKSLDEARIMVDKVEHYLTKKDLSSGLSRGDWRNYVTFLADDADPGSAEDVYFVSSSEKTTNLIKERYPTINIEKIYADAYTQQSGAIGSFYPEAKNALTKRINSGCLLLNYVGHGAAQYIGTERYMEKTDIASYTNRYQLPFFVASTCSFGKYDMDDDVCGAESFVLAPNGGGIAIAAAVRPIGHSESFDTKVCLYALDKNNTIGDAFRMAKNETSMTHAMQLIGDPAIKLSLPENKIVVTAINEKPAGTPSADTATVLTKVTIEGEVRNSNDIIIDDFSGNIYPTVFDRFVTYHTLANDNDETEMEFSQQKNVLYKGRDSVVNGKFKYSFVVPRDVVYQYEYGKLSHYAHVETEDAAGAYSNIMFGGFNQDIEISESRPNIRLFMNDSLFVSGGITDENPAIYAILYDTVGINAVGSGIGHDITAILDGNNNQIMVLNDYYEPDRNNPYKGYIKYPLHNLSNGTHHLTLKAWNIYNFSASASIIFNVNNHTAVHIGNFYSYPNPATTKTVFRLEHNQPEQIKHIQIDIYDMMGHLVQHLTPTVVDGSYAIAQTEWNFTNNAGSKVAEGIYMARIVITTSNGEQHTAYTKIIHTKTN
ncbi:MAG: type IX secretion system sortase PorU [Bacteroidales bacterium]|nr:type IX secretion system sortase PorU [Bacteroidales bacterium]